MLTIQYILTQLGMAAVGSIWQMAIIWLLYKLVMGAFRFRAEIKFRFSLAFILFGTVWFLFSFVSAVSNENTNFTGISSMPLIGMLPQPVTTQLNTLFGACYLAILSVYMVRGKNTMNQIRHFNPTGFPKAPAAIRSFIEQYSTWLEIPRKANLVISSVDVPVTFGWLKPVILLPVACLTKLSTKQLEAILLHELAHIKRNDYLWSLVLYGCEKILWFNPFLLNLVKEARMEAENACDDWVVQFEFCPRDYAFALLQVAKNQSKHSLALAAGGHNDFQLLGRIKRMLGLPAAKSNPGWKQFLVGSFVVWMSFHLIIPGNDQGNSKFVSLPGSFASTTYRNGNNYWEQTVAHAKQDIFEAAVGKNRVPQIKAPSSNKVEITKSPAGTLQDENIIDGGLADQTDKAGSELMISTGWVNGIHEENTDSAINMAWEQFAILLEKLETPEKLKENEWKELTQYIAYHTEIKQAILKDAERQRNPLQPAVDKPEKAEEILLIIFDEATGTLAASLVSKKQFGEEYRISEVSNEEQQVIFLHKKTRNPSKVISL